MATVEYHSNNSGGSWWLKDEDWYALERANWKVDWIKNQSDRLFRGENGRFLGALATSASKENTTMRDAISEWESLTGQSASALGCSCCGTPHSFSSDDGEYYSPSYPMYGEEYSG